MSPRTFHHQRRGLLLTSLLICLLPPAAGATREQEDADEQRIVFEAPTVEARPGDTISTAIRVRSGVSLSLAAFSLKYDATVWNVSAPVLAAPVQAIVDRNPTDSEFLSNLDESAGWVQASVITDFSGRAEFAIPVGDTDIVSFSIHVNEDTPSGTYPIHFGGAEDDGAEDEFKSEFEDSLGNAVYNHARREGTEIENDSKFDDDNDAVLLTDGAVIVSILGDVNVFARGDANSDREIDISDPVSILSYLFLGRDNVTCEDACDSNDDGRLDLSDSVTILQFLFNSPDGGASFSTQLAPDGTPDPLGCAYY